MWRGENHADGALRFKEGGPETAEEWSPLWKGIARMNGALPPAPAAPAHRSAAQARAPEGPPGPAGRGADGPGRPVMGRGSESWIRPMTRMGRW
jgi:hypothetical protein